MFSIGINIDFISLLYAVIILSLILATLLILPYKSKSPKKAKLESTFLLLNKLHKERVVYCHNNLSIDHFLEGKEKYFISWDNYRVDTPILDIINLYKNDYNKYDFRVFLDAYMKRFELNDTEKKLLFIVISMPDIKYFTQNEVDNTIIAGKFIDYIDKTEKLIRPYYAVEKKE